MSTIPVRSLTIAVAQTTYHDDPADAGGFADAGAEVRALMARAKHDGATLIQFPEGTVCFPAKRAVSSDPDRMAEADWQRFAWDLLQAELYAIRAEASRLQLWTVIGVPQASTDGRPTTGLTVIDPTGAVVARYDERVLSHTKDSFLYRAGTDPVVITVNGVRLGLSSGLEIHFPELYSAYERAEVDGVLFATAGPPDLTATGPFATHAVAQASMNQLWLGFSVPAGSADPSGLISPAGAWIARCSTDGPDVAIGTITTASDEPARAWRRSVRESHPALQSTG